MPETRTGRRLILADGTRIENGEAGYADGCLWLWCAGMDMITAAHLFTDPAKTAVILFQYGEMEDRYEGFTDCRYLSEDTDGMASVCMKKPEVKE